MAGGWRSWHAIPLLIALLALVLPVRRSEAVNPELLLMPGKLSKAHQKYEEQCSNCHNRSDRSQERRLCLDCHKDVSTDIDTRHGYHGHLTGIGTAQCRACHSEHQGRTADIVKLSPEQFHHEITDFPLRGAHTTVLCDNCHVAGKRFREAPTECVTCHKAQEPHEGRLGRDCAACHDTTAWGHVNFDHDKTTYPLRDKHLEVACVECHFGNRYKSTPTQCVSCHAPDDVHQGGRGLKCGDCHNTTGWKTARFDHAKETGFALEGIHSRLDCQDCHTSGNLKDKLPRECIGCHQGQDAHASRMGQKCDNCHGNEAWKPSTFNHTRDGHWTLVGRHEKVACDECHTASLTTQKLPTDCVSCHRASDVHSGRLGKSCDPCHTPEGWRSSVTFDHDLTKFPLVGLHVAVPCEQCHLTRKYRDAGHDCIECHSADDVHKGSLGRECVKCHSPNGWRLWEFDHGKETGFALTGKHEKLGCADCHKQPADRVKLKTGCVSCHAEDDVHLGQYGRQCERCHATTTFKGARVH